MDISNDTPILDVRAEESARQWEQLAAIYIDDAERILRGDDSILEPVPQPETPHISEREMQRIMRDAYAFNAVIDSDLAGHRREIELLTSVVTAIDEATTVQQAECDRLEEACASLRSVPVVSQATFTHLQRLERDLAAAEVALERLTTRLKIERRELADAHSAFVFFKVKHGLRLGT